MKSGTIYDRLREIGCSVETSDEYSKKMEPMLDHHIEMVLLWCQGFSYRKIGRIVGYSDVFVRKVVRRFATRGM